MPSAIGDSELQLVNVAKDFLATIKDLTPGKQLELKLNKEHGPGTFVYDEVRLAWHSFTVDRESNPAFVAARTSFKNGSRRGLVSEHPTVYMDSQEPQTLDVFKGQYHAHPYGEVNVVIPISGDNPELEGLNGWRHKGWTCPGPGSHHFPAVRGGSLIALFFLPAGRISYNAQPHDPQPQDPGASLGLAT
ncbi:hypothetical protein OIO90_004219 [Microbotryomycetes sp. JL221]|nr:hypothetical protein OIO90_004219 [Microbotryomycetes sp. JL221]